MQVVIDIPQEVKQAFDIVSNDINFSFYDYNSVIGKAIRHGTVLPEHGRLIDADALKFKMYKHRYLFVSPYKGQSDMPINEKIRIDEISNCIADIVNAPTILEARKENTNADSD